MFSVQGNYVLCKFTVIHTHEHNLLMHKNTLIRIRKYVLEQRIVDVLFASSAVKGKACSDANNLHVTKLASQLMDAITKRK